MLQELYLSICIDECCEIEGVHAPHKVKQKKEKKPRSNKPPWLLTAKDALDESIVRAVCKLDVGSFHTILNEVENDFGSLGPTHDSGVRRLYRRLSAVVRTGKVRRVDVGGRLFAYVKPQSRLAGDIEFLRESLKQMISYSPYERQEI
jgi:hypothetical protein